MQQPDLLEPTPRLRLDAHLFGEAITFAFATGSSPETFERVLKTSIRVAAASIPSCSPVICS